MHRIPDLCDKLVSWIELIFKCSSMELCSINGNTFLLENFGYGNGKKIENKICCATDVYVCNILQ